VKAEGVIEVQHEVREIFRAWILSRANTYIFSYRREEPGLG
jgi:hypothetical protein